MRDLNIVGDVTSNVDMPNVHVGMQASSLYKGRAKEHFASMNIGESFTVKARSVEGVKRWQKDWRRDLRTSGIESNNTLAERGFITKYEVVENTNGCRVWRFK